MTIDWDDDQSMLRSAIARVARALPASDPRAHVFLEDRVDVRSTVASSGHREVVSNRTRGAVVAGRRSMHVTDPDFLDLGKDVDGLAGGLESSRREQEEWVAQLESAIVVAGASVCAGRRHPNWSAKLISFLQDVWVGLPDSEVRSDVRRGCRLELRVQVGATSVGYAVEDQVLRPGDPPSMTDVFVRAFDRAERRTTVLPPPAAGSTTAVFAPGAAGVVIHELVGHALEGDVVARGPTWISSSTLPSAAAPLTVIDDPRHGRGAWTIDDEGSLAGETLLIERGRPVGILHDRASAIRLGTRSTGHGRRSSYLDAVRPRMGCTFIQPGADDPEEVLRSTRKGVFIHRLAGGHTDPISGKASFVVSDADRIVDGRLAEPLDVFVLELDALESWESIDRVGHDLAFDTCVGSCLRDGQPIAISVGAPTIRIGVVGVRF